MKLKTVMFLFAVLLFFVGWVIGDLFPESYWLGTLMGSIAGGIVIAGVLMR